MLTRREWLTIVAGAWATQAAPAAGSPARPGQAPGSHQKFQTGVEVVTVTATVTDADGRLVTDLTAAEFEIFEDGVRQTVTQCLTTRVPISLAVMLDISDSMIGERLKDARRALDRFLFELLAKEDEYALILFNHTPTIAARWTSDPEALRPALDAMRGWGGTAIYDAVNVSLPLFETRHRQRAAGVIISDGADTASDIELSDLRAKLPATDAFFYAVAIDREDPRALSTRVNPYALQGITDDTGGYTEVVTDTAQLAPATARIADELNHQYTLGFTMPHPPDDRFHSLRVRVTRPKHRVRARRGYVASSRRRTFSDSGR
jgi:Ca-activated chloride channel family protein